MITAIQTVQEINIVATQSGSSVELHPVLTVAENTDHDIDGGTL